MEEKPLGVRIVPSPDEPPETKSVPAPVRTEILTYYSELKIGSPRAMALMDAVIKVNMSNLIEGDEDLLNTERDAKKKTHLQSELNQHVAQMAIRKETIQDRLQTVEGYASEYIH